MSKYQPLTEHLATRSGQFWRASFADLEEILGASLPKTAYASNAWWANSPDKLHQKAWLEAGWRVESVDCTSNAVLFHRDGYDPVDEVPERYYSPAPPTPPRPPGQIKRVMGLTAVVGGALALTAALGAVAFKVVRRK